MMRYLLLFLLLFVKSALALELKQNLTASEMYQQADAVVIFQMTSGEYSFGVGDAYKLCGIVKQSLKGKVGEEFCFHDGDDYENECFNRTLSNYYMAFISKSSAGSYSSIWANDSVFEVENSTNGWSPLKCHNSRIISKEVGKKHFTDTPYFERITKILEHAFSKSLTNK